jgi:hypothetical protein
LLGFDLAVPICLLLNFDVGFNFCFEFLAGAEGDYAAGADGDFFTGFWVEAGVLFFWQLNG